MQNLKYTLGLSIIFLMASCGCDFYGSHDLGNNFTLLEGDRLEDRVIVYCAGNKSGCCTGGMYVIPTAYEAHFDTEGKYLEYVEEAKSNEKWIVVKTVQKDIKARYWLIDKDFDIEGKYKDTPLPKKIGKELKMLIQSQISDPLNVIDFNKRVQELNINLNFD